MKKPAVEGEGRVSPCLLVDSIEEELHFLEVVFGAQITRRGSLHPESIWAAEARLGDTVIMIGHRPGHDEAIRSTVYVRTAEVEATFARAMSAGASHISIPTEDTSDQREAGFIDPQGNVWWIGQGPKQPSNQEVERRLAEQRRQRL